MTALAKYERLEALGVWRSHAQAPGREIYVKFGRSTLVLEVEADVPMAAWSLPALRLVEEDESRAIYAPDFESSETLVVEDAEMRAALAQVLAARIDAPKRRRYRVPFLVAAAGLAAAALVAVLNLPALLGSVAPAFVAPERARLLGVQLLSLVEERTGPACKTRAGVAALDKLAFRLVPRAHSRIVIADLGDLPFLALPGETVMVNRHIAEAAASPEEFAGWVVLAYESDVERPALGQVFRAARVGDGLGFLANGTFSDRTLDAAATRLIFSADLHHEMKLEAAALRLADVGIPAEPLALGIMREDVTAGPLRLPVVEGSSGGPMVLADGDWVALQAICEG